jgi:hypothetical protein
MIKKNEKQKEEKKQEKKNEEKERTNAYIHIHTYILI